jgi:hypothetical protein
MIERTIWIVASGTRHTGLHTIVAPHLALRDTPVVGETIVAILRARLFANRWTVQLAQNLPGCTFGYGGVVRLHSAQAYARGLGDDSDAPEPQDITEELCRAILLGGCPWEAAPCRVELLDTNGSDPVQSTPYLIRIEIPEDLR